MASIRRRGKYFGAQFRIPEPDGTWRLVSVATKLSDVNEARRFAQASEQMALKAAAADKTHGLEYCEILLQAIRDAGASRLTESKAREHLSRICEVARGKPLVSYSVRNWFAEYLRQKKPNVAASTIAAYEWGYLKQEGMVTKPAKRAQPDPREQAKREFRKFEATLGKLSVPGRFGPLLHGIITEIERVPESDADTPADATVVSGHELTQKV